MSNFFQESLVERGLEEFRLIERIDIDKISYGMVAHNPEESKMFRHFFENNDDNRELMASIAMADHQVSHKLHLFINQLFI